MRSRAASLSGGLAMFGLLLLMELSGVSDAINPSITRTLTLESGACILVVPTDMNVPSRKIRVYVPIILVNSALSSLRYPKLSIFPPVVYAFIYMSDQTYAQALARPL